MKLILFACLAVSVIALMVLFYLLTQIDLLHEMLRTIRDEIGADIPNPQGPMDLMLLKPKKHRKSRRFTDKSRDWLYAHEHESRR